MNYKHTILLVFLNLFAFLMFFCGNEAVVLGKFILAVEVIIALTILNPPQQGQNKQQFPEDEIIYKRKKPVNKKITLVPRAPAPKKPQSKPRFKGAHLNRTRSRQFEILSEAMLTRQNHPPPPRMPKALTAAVISLTALAFFALSYRQTITLEGEGAIQRTSLFWGTLPLGEVSVAAEEASEIAPFETIGSGILLAEVIFLLLAVISKTFHPASTDLQPYGEK